VKGELDVESIFPVSERGVRKKNLVVLAERGEYAFTPKMNRIQGENLT